MSFWEAGVAYGLGQVRSLILPSVWGWKLSRCSRLPSPPSLRPSLHAPITPIGARGAGSSGRGVCVPWAREAPFAWEPWGRSQEGKESHHPPSGALSFLLPLPPSWKHLLFSQASSWPVAQPDNWRGPNLGCLPSGAQLREERVD